MTPRDLRVPGGALRQHPNGVAGIGGVAVATENSAATGEAYAALLGADATGPAFAVGAAAITLMEPAVGAAYGPVQEQLARRGAGAFALALRGSSSIRFDAARTHGVALEGSAQ